MAKDASCADTNSVTLGALPVNLRVLNHDKKLQSILFSGDFKNTLSKPLHAWRGELHLHDSQQADNKPIVVFFEHQARRPVNPEQWGVWSFWLDLDSTVSEHQALKDMNIETGHITVELRLLRVLFADGSQQAF